MVRLFYALISDANTSVLNCVPAGVNDAEHRSDDQSLQYILVPTAIALSFFNLS